MKKIYLPTLFLLLQISLVSAQTNLANWLTTDTSTEIYPRSGVGISSELASATEDYIGLNATADPRDVWSSSSTSATVDPNTSPYLSYVLAANSGIAFDRFVLGSAAVTGALKLQLRWSVDSYASSLGDFTPLNGSYHLFSVDLSSTSLVSAGTIEFRVYFYNASGRFYNPGNLASYTSLDGTPSSYKTADSQSVSIWGSPSALSTDNVKENELKIRVYPNPSSDFIKVTGITTSEKYSIYNILGAKVKEGSVLNKQEINVKNLISGLYFIQLESRSTIKFMKE